MASFGDELGRLTPHMRRFARALVKGHSVHVADELVQETIVLALRAERLARGEQLRSWCFATLIRVHRLWNQTLNGRDDMTRQTSGAFSIPDEAETRGPLAFVPRDIARLDLLPIDAREVLLLTVLVGMNYRQVAETLHVNVEMVLTRLDLARGILARGQRPVPGTSSSGNSSPRKLARAAEYLQLVK